jgi:uncharacterized protein with gpF-like domain
MSNKEREIDKRLLATYIELDNFVALMFKKESLNDFLETTESYLIDAYVNGFKDTLTELGQDTALIDEINIIPNLQTALEQVEGGMTYRNRIILGYFEYSTAEMQRLITNEYHRVYNTGAYNAAETLQRQGTNIGKRWHTMLDERVRDTHAYLEGDVVLLGDYFYTWDGDRALYPGDFMRPENDIGCRCRITYEKI